MTVAPWWRARALPPLVGISVAARLLCASVLAIGPARFVGHWTRHFPRGEVALVDNGASLLLELYYRGEVALSVPSAAVGVGLSAVALGLLTHGATIAIVQRPEVGIGAALRTALVRMAPLVFITGLGALSFASLALAALLVFAALPATSPWPHAMVLFIASGLGACIAIFVDAARVRTIVVSSPTDQVFRSAAIRAYDRFGWLFVRYVAAGIVQLAALLGAVFVTTSLVLGATWAVVLAATSVVLSNTISVVARTWFVAAMVASVGEERFTAPRESGDNHVS